MEEKKYEIVQIDETTWAIEDGIVRFFLLKGKNKAMFIDGGLDIDGIKDIAKDLVGADFPLELINTHGDGDHVYGNKEFEWFYMHEADYKFYKQQHGGTSRLEPVTDGQIIDLGERPLQVIHVPGHTKGSIAVLDINHRALYPGDSVYNGNVFMFGESRALDEYPASLMKLESMDDMFDVIYASHQALEYEPEQIGDMFDALERIFHGEVEPLVREFHNTLVDAYVTEAAVFLIDRERNYYGREFEE